MFIVHVLFSLDYNKIYIGQTADFETRLQYHNELSEWLDKEISPVENAVFGIMCFQNQRTQAREAIEILAWQGIYMVFDKK